MIKSIQKTFNEEFLIVFESKPNDDKSFHWVDFRVYEISATENGKPLFNKDGYTGSGEWTEKIEDAQIYLVGFVKWDGCCEFEIKDHVHFCGRQMAHMLTRMIDAIYDTTISDFGFTAGNIK